MLRQGSEDNYVTLYQSPCTITQINESGTVQMKIYNVEVTMNIGRITPYLGPDDIPHGGEYGMQRYDIEYQT